MTIPATGKTTFFMKAIDVLKEKHSDKVKVYSVSSDVVRMNVMDELQARTIANGEKELTEDQLFSKSTKPAKTRFDGIISSILG